MGWLLIDIYLSYNHDPDIASREEAINRSIKIEKLTGFRLPDFDVINYKSSGYTLFGDFADTIVVRFRSVPSEKVQNQLEESSVFHITNDSTGYDYINNKRDFTIKITLDKKSNTGEIMLFNGLVPRVLRLSFRSSIMSEPFTKQSIWGWMWRIYRHTMRKFTKVTVSFKG